MYGYGSVVDDGETIIYGGGRTHPDYGGHGYASALTAHGTKCLIKAYPRVQKWISLEYFPPHKSTRDYIIYRLV